MINLIGITGPARHGKDTVGQMLLSHMPAGKQFAFAGKIKEFLHSAMNAFFTDVECKEGEQTFFTDRGAIAHTMLTSLHKGIMQYSNEKDAVDSFLEVLEENHENYKVSPDGTIIFTSSWRKLFQLTGTQWGRQRINENFWIEPYLPESEAVVTDVRGHGDTEEFLNIEAEAIINRGGIIIEVVDPRKSKPQVRAHASEAGISRDLITAIVVNDSTLEALEGKVHDLIYKYLLEGEQ